VPRWIHSPFLSALSVLFILAGVVVLVAGGDPEIGILAIVVGALDAVFWPALRVWTPSKNPDDYR
jgi:hypothetical protein